MLAENVEEPGQADERNQNDEHATNRRLALPRAITIAGQGQVLGRLRHLHSVRGWH